MTTAMTAPTVQHATSCQANVVPSTSCTRRVARAGTPVRWKLEKLDRAADTEGGDADGVRPRSEPHEDDDEPHRDGVAHVAGALVPERDGDPESGVREPHRGGHGDPRRDGGRG